MAVTGSLIEMEYYRPRELVTYGRSPQVYRVIRMKQVNLLVEAENGSHYNLKMTHGAVHRAPADATFTPVNPVVTETLHLGDTVRFKGVNAHRYPGVYVVASFTTQDRAKFVKLNAGDNVAITGDRSVAMKVEL